ncbi:14 kDa phosphohistidine phosphatase-like [Achroia grisella]|uniref:14 kDa phosphohistidine phosphatase-like n=1 Tax=Achroia grisella TaxID=688607 RepID=UPI0027D2D87E|nr:14 kDa phosphohistidine phosphatase-like [Achroia grisella]
MHPVYPTLPTEMQAGSYSGPPGSRNERRDSPVQNGTCGHVAYTPFRLISLQTIKTMASSSLADVPTVDIDPSGVFKYMLIKLYDRKQSEENFVYIVRGYCRCIYHSDVYVEVQEKLHPLDCDIVGGGSISHEPSSKKIRIYGHAHGYGKADHEITAKLIKAAFPNYKITISDKAY